MTTPGTDETMPEWSDEDKDFIDESIEPTTPTNFAVVPSLGPKDAASLPAKLNEFFSKRPGGMASHNFIVTVVTQLYLDTLTVENPPNPHRIEEQLLSAYNEVAKLENTKAGTAAEKHQLAKHLTAWQVAQVMLRLHHIIRIAPNKKSETDYDLLSMYRSDGDAAGTYTSSEDELRTIARRYNTAMSLNEFKEVLAILREDSPRVPLSMHRDLLAVGNGVFYYGKEPLDITIRGKEFHFKPKQVHPFDPALVFRAKTHINYVEDAPEQIITHPVDGSTWDVVSWINDLFDQDGDEGLSELIWEVLSAVVRPYVSWGKTAWFYSEVGNNGKGTLCELMRNLVGPDAHTSVPLSDLGKDFALEPIMNVNAIIVDENDVGTFIDKAANLKTIITNDVVPINRKHKVPVAFQFWGLMVQCLNEFPRMKDKSESNYRRQLFVPFNKSFTGKERKYIKNDYLQRREVLEYVLWYALNRAGTDDPGNFYEFAEPEGSQAALAEYKMVNDPVRAFWDEFREEFVWDLLPFPFLYDLYKAWFVTVSPSGSPVSRQQFVTDLVSILRSDEMWHCPDKGRKIRPGQMLNKTEYLIATYELKAWYSPKYTGTEPEKLCRPVIQPNYRGVLRQATAPLAPTGDPGTSTTDDNDQD